MKEETAQLDALRSTTEWITHITRASLHLEGAGVIHGVTGDEIAKNGALDSRHSILTLVGLRAPT